MTRNDNLLGELAHSADLRKAEVTIPTPFGAHGVRNRADPMTRSLSMEESSVIETHTRRYERSSKPPRSPDRFTLHQRKGRESNSQTANAADRFQGGLAFQVPTFPSADNQGLEPCEAGFGDQPAPCALSIVEERRIELRLVGCRPTVLPLSLFPLNRSDWI